jgi:ribosome biogenesis GTPase A
MKRQRTQQSPGTSPLLYCCLIMLATINGVAARFARSSSSVGFIASQQLYRSASTKQKNQEQRTINYVYPTNDQEETEVEVRSGYSRPVVQWYPGHIAKAERQLKETFKAVDVVVEVRDARAAKATSHPMVGAWCAGRPRLVVLTHVDAIPTVSQNAWSKAYADYGAEHPDQADVIDKQVQNQASQALRERLKYKSDNPAKASTPDNKPAKGKAAKEEKPQQLSNVEYVLFVNAKDGAGIHALTRAIFKAGSHVQERRDRRGLKERPLRVGVIGYPNVGKSALINRLLGKKRARTANKPGVTKSLQWIRVKTDDSKTKRGKEFELLDSPGVIPAVLVDQSDATLLAACNCIGEAAYDNQAVAAYLCEWLLSLYRLGYGPVSAPDWQKRAKERYAFDPLADKVDPIDGTSAPRTGEDMLFEVAANTCQGDPEDAARKILQDYRSGRMGLICLQVAPQSKEDKGQVKIQLGTEASIEAQEVRQQERSRAQEERAQAAMQTAMERGLELPPARVEHEEGGVVAPDQVGKGQFDGW